MGEHAKCVCTCSRDRLLSWDCLHCCGLFSLVSNELELVLVLPGAQGKGDDGHGLIVVHRDGKLELAFHEHVVLTQITSRETRSRDGGYVR